MTRLVKLMRLSVALAGISAGFSLAAMPITASADYNNTGATWYYQSGYTQADTHFWESPPGGDGWYSEVIWSSTVYTNFWSTTAQFYGSSDAYWWGSNPWCATDITLTDNWGATGVAVSASIPGAAGFSGSSSGPIQFQSDGPVCNDWYNRTEHNYSQITLNGFDLYTFDQQSCAVFKFSYQSNNRCGPFSWDWVNL